MKLKLLLLLFSFFYQFSFSQSEKLLKGILSSDNFLLENVDVINKSSQKSTITNDKGEFIIEAIANDSLLFYSKDYYLKKIKLSNEQIKKNNLQVVMIKKPEELKEVVVNQMKSIRLSTDKNYEQKKLDDLDLEKRDGKLRTGVYDGFIENGMTFVKRLFISKNKPQPEVEFATLAKNTCDQRFYIETLKLKPEEINLFLQFCDADPKSKSLIEYHNVLTMMEFLLAKNIEFKKLDEVLR
ncbi:hypothetical protein FLA105534_04867 [Flavobacterium bizetiae]|uniref:CarboxypepD_reg-like domain-containing protein n=1 Tax=Flavobacterium bizetiae TaxID=2704140 RepID=A0A6J4GXS1_9FLAO|nr:hypothetical protein [Flavobacterium bizetiae]CAA9203687.1 hypothetical protein FLA105534_04867 [Flavobacterium bizetiae]CAD5344941.1 hypothetical protein FLA105535_04953 [Flavobacterium bizetiae]CAD5350905.1 hypothetical protein FLA105534_04906 [Flavobacterium bizetiae]